MTDPKIYKILIVDNNQKYLNILRRYLYQDRRYQYEILETKLIGKVWEICDRNWPNLILLDYFLPDNNGLGFLQEWHNRYNTSIIPVVILTQKSNEKIAVEVIQNGAQDYCVKEKLTVIKFQQLVHNVLERLQLKQQIYRQQQQQNLVNSIALRIRQSLHLNSVLQRTVEEVRQFLHTDRVFIWQFDSNMGGMIVTESVLPQYISCLNNQIQDHCFNEKYFDKYQKGRFFMASDIYRSGLAECHIKMLEKFQVKANLIVPILLNNNNNPEVIDSMPVSENNSNNYNLWGLLIAHQCDRPRQWHDDELNLLQMLAIQIAIAIQQAEMYEKVQAELYEKIQAELREKQRVAAEFRALVENAPDIIFRIDRDMRYLYYNPAIENLIHQPASSLIGKTPEALGVSPDIIALWRAMVDRIIETGVQETIETPFPDWNSQIWFQVRVVPEFNLNNKIESFLCIARDISDRKQHESILQLQAEMLDQINDAVISTDINGIIQTWNKGAENLYGYHAQEAIGKHITILAVSEDLPHLFTQIMANLLAHGHYEIEAPSCTKSGLKIYINLRLRVIINDNNIIRLIGCCNDITKRKQNENILQLQAEMLDQIHDAVVSTDINGIIQTWNKGAEKFYGYTAVEAIGQNVNFIYKNTQDVATKIIPHLIVQGSYETETVCLSKSGTEIDISLRLSVIHDAEGNIIRLIGCSNDITERKQNEITLQLQAEMLDQIHDAVVSTDIKGIIQTWNKGAEKLYGYNAQEVVGNHITILYWPEDLDQISKLVFEPLLVNGIHEIEMRNRTKSGAEIYINLRLSIIHDAEGKIIRLIGCSNDITERKRNEKTLKMQVQMLDQIHDGVISTDINGIIQTWNQGAEKLHGYTAAEVIGQPITLLCFPEDAEQMAALVFPPLLEKGNHEVEVRNRTKLGQEIYVSLRLSMIRDEAGKILRLIGCSNDITERKKIEQELQELNQKLELRVEKRTAELQESQRFIQTITENIPNIIYIFDLQKMRNIYCNREIGNLLGYSPEEIQAMGDRFISNLTHPDDLEKLFIYFNNLKNLKDGEKANNEYRLRNIDGKWRWFLSIDTPFLRDQEGKIKQIIGTAQDITERKEIEEKLRNLSDRLSIAIESGGFGIWEWDILSDKIIWDDRMYQLYEINKTDYPEPKYNIWFTKLHPEDREIVTNTIKKTLEEQREYEQEIRLINSDGSIRYLKVYAFIQRNKQGTAVRMIGLNSDITKAKKAEQELRQINERLTLTNAELDRATKLKDEFLANMSHELRTPLNAILGMTEALQDGVFGQINDKQKTAVDSIDRSGNHLLTLINDVLDLAKVESGKLELQLTPTSITYLCRNSLNFVRQQAIKKNIQLTTEISGDLPDIVIDELRIRQVLINLLSNAVKFTPEGGSVKLVVQRVQSSDNNWLHLLVIDTGIGMTEENASKLFQPFIQIDSSLNRKYTGTGLGLALVRRLVNLHHGTVSVTSQLGQGSCFTVRLPYILSENTKIQPSVKQPNIIKNTEENLLSKSISKSPQNAIISPIEPTSLTILLVEDNEFNIATISSYLRSKGYKIIIAKDGEEGVRMAKSEQPGLILMDIQLPNIDGLEAIRQIRAEETLALTPIIALTALAMPGDEEKCLLAGANGYMSKPVKLKQLADKIQTLLQSK